MQVATLVASGYQTLQIETQGAVEALILNRADALNSLNRRMIAELLHYFRGLADRPEVRVVLLRGAGRAFSAGFDLAGSVTGSQAPDQLVAMLRMQEDLSQIVLGMRRCPQPIVALLHGAAAGGGFALGLAADVRIAAPNLRLIPSFVRIGLSGGDCGSSYFLPRLVGRSIASEILMTGRSLDAERALRIGLLSEVVEEAQLLDAGHRMAAEMLRASPMGLRMTKDVLNLNEHAPGLEAAVALENRTQVLLGQTADAAEGVAAFLHKRMPNYQGH